jgi:cyclohexanone monooxygenase
LHVLDVLVLATGYDAMTGPLLSMNITGRGGRTLREHWAHGPRTYLGLAVHGFPNLFTITGPQSPSVLYNMPLAIEDHVDWIADLIVHMRREGIDEVEASRSGEEAWGAETRAIADATLMARGNSWYVGANVPGKPRSFMVYLGGAPAYRSICARVSSGGFEGFVLDGRPRELGDGTLAASPLTPG